MSQKGRVVMLGLITLSVGLIFFIGSCIYQIITKQNHLQPLHKLRIISFALFFFLLASRIYSWGFRWYGLFAFLAFLAFNSVMFLRKSAPKQKPYTLQHSIVHCLICCMILAVVCLPAIVFPQFTPLTPTGLYSTDTSSITMINETFKDPYNGNPRKLTVQFWYPETASEELFPLVIFSHGSFGLRTSNISTFEELASHGYVVASIDHSYHSFYVSHNDGTTAMVNQTFLNDAIAISNEEYDADITFALTHQWLDLRYADMNHALNTILMGKNIPHSVNSMINHNKIGVFGHSLGGATAALLGRQRNDIDAVIVIDGTMIGEETIFHESEPVFESTPYPVPILNFYNEDHYNKAKSAGLSYNNTHMSFITNNSYEVVIQGSGHLNFTDLPLFSPFLAGLLGTGTVNARECIETMNAVILKFFDSTLKDSGILEIKNQY